MRILVTVLSVLLVLLIGFLGEQLINVYEAVVGNERGGAALITELVTAAFPLNSGSFSLSVTPFAALFVTLLLIARGGNWSHENFTYAFLSIWLCLGLYFIFFLAALMGPFQLLRAVINRSALPVVLCAMNGVILLSGFLCALLSLRKRSKSRAAG